MSELETHHLKLPYIAAAQAQKHVTHNEALRMLDSLVQLTVTDADRTEPPVSPVEGDRHIVATGASGAWTGRVGQVASRIDGAWSYAMPADGWLAYDLKTSALLVFRDGGWSVVTAGAGSADRLGINATADEVNRLAVRSESVLFSAIEDAGGGSGDVRLTMNKETAADTASLVFQSGWTGRAEIGLTGDADLVLKVSADGLAWTEAIRIDSETGVSSIRYDNAGSGLDAETVQEAIDELAATGGGGGSVASVFGRAGVVSAQAGDYQAGQIANDSAVPGDSVKDALEELALGVRERLAAPRTYYVRTPPRPVTAISNASPAVITLADHGLQAGDAVVFETSGSLPAGLTAGEVYHVLAAGLTGGAFLVSETADGPAVNTTSAGSGTHTFQTGNDANSGLGDTPETALMTAQGAFNRIVGALDLSGQIVTIQLADGHYSGGLTVSLPWTGGGRVTVAGANATGVTLAGVAVSAALPGALILQNLRIEKPGGLGIGLEGSGTVRLGQNVDFGACSYHVFQNGPGSYFQAASGYSISAPAYQHAYVAGPCFFQVEGGVVDIAGAPAFSGAFLNASNGCFVRITATFTGTASGKRYSVTKNASVEVKSASGPDYLPGNVAGTTATGGQYN